MSALSNAWTVGISNTPSHCFVFAFVFVFVFVFLSPLWAAWCAGSGHCRQPLHGSTSTSCFLNLQSWWWWWFWSQGAVLRRYYSEITLWLYPPGFSWGLQGLNCFQSHRHRQQVCWNRRYIVGVSRGHVTLCVDGVIEEPTTHRGNCWRQFGFFLCVLSLSHIPYERWCKSS